MPWHEPCCLWFLSLLKLQCRITISTMCIYLHFLSQYHISASVFRGQREEGKQLFFFLSKCELYEEPMVETSINFYRYFCFFAHFLSDLWSEQSISFNLIVKLWYFQHGLCIDSYGFGLGYSGITFCLSLFGLGSGSKVFGLGLVFWVWNIFFWIWTSSCTLYKHYLLTLPFVLVWAS